MSLPPILKMMDVFGDGESWIGQVNSITLPTLGRQMEEYRGTYGRPVEIDLGGTLLEIEFKTAGFKAELATKMGQTMVGGNSVRFVGAYQSDDNGGWTAVEIYVRGRIKELNRGDAKVGELGEESTKMTLVYYREVVNGVTTTEIDVLNHIELIGGVDRLAEARRIIGQ
jgi:uncharacterized protein